MFLSPSSKNKTKKNDTMNAPLSSSSTITNHNTISASSNTSTITHPRSVPHSYKYSQNKRKQFHRHHDAYQHSQLETVRFHLPIVSPSESSPRAPKNTKTKKTGSIFAPLFPHLKDSNDKSSSSTSTNPSQDDDGRTTTPTDSNRNDASSTTGSSSNSSIEKQSPSSSTSSSSTPKASGKSTRIIKAPASVPCLRQKRRLFVENSSSTSKFNFENDNYCRINNISNNISSDNSSNSSSSDSTNDSKTNTTLLCDYDGGDPSHNLNKKRTSSPQDERINSNRTTNANTNTSANYDSLLLSAYFLSKPYPLSPSSKKKTKKKATVTVDTTTEKAGVKAKRDAGLMDTPIAKNSFLSASVSSPSSFSKYNVKNRQLDHYDKDEIMQAARILCQIKSDKLSSSSSSCSNPFNPFLFMPSLLSSSSHSFNTGRQQQYKPKGYHYQHQPPQTEIYQDLTNPIDYPYTHSPSRSIRGNNSTTISHDGHKRERDTKSSLHHRSSLVFRSSSSFSTVMKPNSHSSNRRLSKNDIYDHIIHSEQTSGRNSGLHVSASTSTGASASAVDDSDDMRSIDETEEECYNEYDTHSCTTNDDSDCENHGGDEDKENVDPENEDQENDDNIHNHHVEKKETSLPNRLALPNDKLEVNSLHCYVRSELLELFVVPSPDENNANCNKRKNNKNRNGNSTPLTQISTNRRNIPGRVGLRCIYCKHHQMKKKQRHRNQYTKCDSSSSSFPYSVDTTEIGATSCDVDATKADFYPRSLQQLYREVCTWQRVHFQHCRHIPKSVRDQYNHWKESDKTRGKTKYWESSARELGLVNAFSTSGDNDGIRFNK